VRQFSELRMEGGRLHWLESGSGDSAATRVMRLAPNGVVEALTGPSVDVGDRVHEYGGGAYSVYNGTLFYSDRSDGRIWRHVAGKSSPVSAPGADRFADWIHDPARNRLISVREQSRASGDPANTLVAVDLSTGAVGEPLYSRADFVSDPCLSPAGGALMFLAWDQPNMPWDFVRLMIGKLRPYGGLEDVRTIADDQSILDPKWGPDGAIYFMSDRDGFWAPFQLKDGVVTKLCDEHLDFGRPRNALGQRIFDFAADGRMLATFVDRGDEGLAIIDTVTGHFERLPLPIVEARHLAVAGDLAYLVAGFTDRPRALIQLDLVSGAWRTIRSTTPARRAAERIAAPRKITFPTGDGETAHAILFPPDNGSRRFRGGTPTVVNVHGGPISHRTSALDPDNRYWTSRGFAYVELNHRGSSGYGRAYRRRLYGRWGEIDVEDALQVARYLVSSGLAEPGRLILRGGSAGGTTTLAAIAQTNPYAAAADYYGISDLGLLASAMHKFEAGLLRNLIGPYPERADLYRSRSALTHADRISTPLIIFQGLLDRVVPPDQSRRIAGALAVQGRVCRLVEFADEAHGFRNPAVIAKAFRTELAFYKRCLHLTLETDQPGHHALNARQTDASI
jgi:dipeptidyl aminopeptidase/acylaminoacyl peptidase